jgi:hypothetical protein
MSYNDEWAALEAKIRDVQRLVPLSGYVRDGIVNLAYWQQQQIRPLFIGKEAHDGKKKGEEKAPAGSRGWSITEGSINANPVKLCRESRHSWPKTAYVAHALQQGFPAYEARKQRERLILEALRTAAFINIGKQVGETQTSHKRLRDMYKQNRLLLHDQIALCQPNVIICWNTLGVFEKDSAFIARFGVDKSPTVIANGVRSWTANGCVFVAAKHPAYFKIPPARYVDSLVSAVRAHIEAGRINLDLPTGILAGALSSSYPKPARQGWEAQIQAALAAGQEPEGELL